MLTLFSLITLGGKLWCLSSDFDTAMTLAADGGAASTPKMQTRPPSPPIKVAPAISTCDSSSVNTGARTPKTEANLRRAGPIAASTGAKRGVIK